MSTLFSSPSRVELSIRALTTAIYLVQPRHAASETPVPSAQGSSRALSKAYNHLAILLTQGEESDGGAGRQVVAVTGRASSSGVAVSAIAEVEDLPPIPSITVTRNPNRKAQGKTLVEVKEIMASNTPLKDLADTMMKFVYCISNLPRLTPGPVALIRRFRSTSMHQSYFELLSITRETAAIICCFCGLCGCVVIARSRIDC